MRTGKSLLGFAPKLALATLLLAAGGARAQEPLRPAVPFAPAAKAAPTPGAEVVTLAAAQAAQALGFDTVAASDYRQLLADNNATMDRAALTLALATVLLDDGKPDDAHDALNHYVGLHGSAWHLREGLADAQLKRWDDARTALGAVRQEELSAADKAWYFFLEGQVANASQGPDRLRAGDLFAQADRAATTDLARARFQIAREIARLAVANPDDNQIRQARANYDRFQGSATGYDFARPYAAMLNAVGRKAEAYDFLQHVVTTLPPEERARGDDFRLLIGLIGDPKGREGASRKALTQLLETGVDADKQRMALQLLARQSIEEPMRGAFHSELDTLIGPATSPTKHRILETLLLFRAQVALAEKDNAHAEDDASRLLKEFPGSPLRIYAYGVLASSAWEQRRYRAAADNVRRARTELAAATEPERQRIRVQLGVLEAEAWFRAGAGAEAAGATGAEDYRNAADAYAAAIREQPPGEDTSALLFQRVLAEIRTAAKDSSEHALDAVQALLDEAARDPVYQTSSEAMENRWEAEYNLARALQLQGLAGVRQAYDRVTRLLAPGGSGSSDAAALGATLRARMGWLQARLALDVGAPAETLQLVGALRTVAGELNGENEAALKNEIISSSALLTAEADFKLNRESDALAALAQVRKDFPKSDAAVKSYIVEAMYQAQQYKAVSAEQLFINLADQFPDRPEAAYALYQAALQAESRGQNDNYGDAVKQIERLATTYPTSDLLFQARLEQGNLLCKLNQFPVAQQVYEDLRTRFPQHADAIYAELNLARCHNAQGHTEAAKNLYEEVRDRVDAPVDARIEAGFNLGELLVRRGEETKALEVWWDEVVKYFLTNPDPKSPNVRLLDSDAKGRHWMSRTLLRSAEIYEKQARLEEARTAWSLIVDKGLPGGTTARERLKRFGLAEGKP